MVGFYIHVLNLCSVSGPIRGANYPTNPFWPFSSLLVSNRTQRHTHQWLEGCHCLSFKWQSRYNTTCNVTWPEEQTPTHTKEKAWRGQGNGPRLGCLAVNQDTKGSQRKCCIYCCCLRGLCLHPAWHKLRLPSPGGALHCCWRSHNSGPHPERWRWLAPAKHIMPIRKRGSDLCPVNSPTTVIAPLNPLFPAISIFIYN